MIIDKFQEKRKRVAVYGTPTVGVFTDNGGEFNKNKCRRMADSYIFSLKTFAGYSPGSKGV